MIEAILALAVVGVMFCYAQMRYHEGMIDGLTAAEKIYRESMKEARRI